MNSVMIFVLLFSFAPLISYNMHPYFVRIKILGLAYVLPTCESFMGFISLCRCVVNKDIVKFIQISRTRL